MSSQRILNHFATIEDEKIILIESLNGVVEKVSHGVDILKNSPNLMSNEDLQKLFFYEIALVRHLAEINLGFIEFQNNYPFPILCVSESFLTTKNDEKSKDQDHNNSEIDSNLSVPLQLNNTINIDAIKENLKVLSTKFGNLTATNSKCSDAIILDTETFEFTADDSCTSTETEVTHSVMAAFNINDSEFGKFENAEKPYCTIEEKLQSMKIHNRNQETKKFKAIPDIKMLPVEPPSVIKNNLQENSNSKKLKKGKNCNEEFAEIEIKQNKMLKLGSICAFSHIENPGEFYVHVANEDLPLLDQLDKDIGKICRGTNTPYNSKEEAFINIGKIGFAYISKYKEWYRIQVLDWFLHDKHREILVQLLDYGNKVEISWKFLRKMTKELADIPVYAVKCYLPYLYPPGSTPNNKVEEWPESSVDAIVGMSGLFDNNNKLFKVVFVEDHGDSLTIDLYNIINNDEKSTIGKILLELGQAVEIVDNEYKGYTELEEFLGNLPELEAAENLNEAIVGYDATDEARICKFTKPDGTCWKKNCPLEHKQFLKGGYTSDKYPIYQAAFNLLDLPPPGEMANILITGFSDCCTFFGQIVKTPVHPTKEYSFDQDLYNLVETMNNRKVVNSYLQFKVWPALGEVVIAKHTTDKWVRGVVTDIETDQFGDPQKALVHIVDFGDNLELPLSAMRQIKEDFLHLPFQLVEVSLENVESVSSITDKKVQKYLNTEICYKNFLAYFTGTESPYPVRLTNFNGQDIGELLIKQNFAKQRTSDINFIGHVIL